MRSTQRLAAKIRAPLKQGEARRYQPVAPDDPARVRLVRVCTMRDAAVRRTEDRWEERVPEWEWAPAWAWLGHVILAVWRQDCQRYVSDNEGLAIAFANNNRVAHVPQEDVKNAAIAGLLEAVLRYDLSKAGKFSTFAVWRMRYEVDQLIHDQQGGIAKVPGQLRDDQWRIQTAERAIACGSDRYVEDAEILAYLQLQENAEVETWRLAAQEDAATTKPPQRRWAKSTPETIKTLRQTYTGAGYASLDPREPHEGEDVEVRLAVRSALKKLSPMLQAVLAEEFDLENVDRSLLPECPVKRATALQLAMRKIGRELE